MLNNINLCGRTTTDIELKTTPNGKSVASFKLAVDRDFSVNGERETDFIPIVVWGKTAEFASKYFTKGKMMVLSGRLQIRNYTDNDGNKRYVTEVVATNIYFCGSKSDNNSGNNSVDIENDPLPAFEEKLNEFNEVPDCSDDDLPF